MPVVITPQPTTYAKIADSGYLVLEQDSHIPSADHHRIAVAPENIDSFVARLLKIVGDRDERD